MKQIKFSILILAIVSILSCKKDNLMMNDESSTGLYARQSLFNITLNPTFGFLEFENYEELKEYFEFLNENTHEDIQISLTEDGFTSYGHNLYNYNTCEFDNIPLDEEQINYLIADDGVFMIDSIIIKFTSDSLYFFTLRFQDLDSSSYSELVSESFNSELMNKISAFQVNDFDLMEFISGGELIGYVDTESEPTEEAKPPFRTEITTVKHCTRNAQTAMCDCTRTEKITKYRFWIKWSEKWGDVIEAWSEEC